MYDELTEVDIQKMKDEIDYRTRELRPKLIEEVKVARGFGDLSENFEYKAAKREKNRNDSRIRYLQRMVDTAKVISDHSSGDVVGLFDKVVIYIPDDDEEQTIRLVTTLRQNALEGLISKESPVGKAVMGHRAGETVQALRKPWIMMLSPFQKAKPGAQSAPDGAANLPAPQIGIEAGLVPSSSPAAPESAQRENAFL